ncbi:hypothetical protein B7486_68080, partial [cyanobacterium TDX16]
MDWHHGFVASSDATTVDEYLAELPDDRREVVAAVRELVNARLPDGYEETVQYGMISWVVPIERSGPTYNGQPLAYVSLANQKQKVSLYLMGVYGASGSGHEADFRAAYEASAGRKPDMGKSCVRFKALDELPLDVIGDEVARVSVDDFIAL